MKNFYRKMMENIVIRCCKNEEVNLQWDSFSEELLKFMVKELDLPWKTCSKALKALGYKKTDEACRKKFRRLC